jgi:copper oxidase (laccase) domain-containing protein
LEAAGVPSQNIEALGVCTFCDAGRFFSYRREKESAGRMTSFIRIRTEIRPR